MIKLIKRFNALLNFQSLEKDMKKLVFYSEGPNYWTHFEAIINYLLDKEINITYVSSHPLDPGLRINNKHYKSYEIGDGFFRNWFFENLDCKIIVMTMPDLDTYQIKRSKHNPHYVYTQHSLVSLHMSYGEKAFHAFDTIFCCGPHHKRELREIEKVHKLKPKKVLEHGYPRLDSLMRHNNSYNETKSLKRILFAPTWGPNGVVETGVAREIISRILDKNIGIIFRPHPQTIRYAKKEITNILNQFNENANFFYETNVSNTKSLIECSAMLSDWGGSAIEFSLATSKPVVFLDVPKKVFNQSFSKHLLKPFEEMIRKKIGIIIHPQDKDLIPKIIDSISMMSNSYDLKNEIYNIGKSEIIAGDYLIKQL